MSMKELYDGFTGLYDEVDRLRDVNKDLLEALKWMVEHDETNQGDEPMPERGNQTWNEINAYWIEGLNKARAAIAKAEGRS